MMKTDTIAIIGGQHSKILVARRRLRASLKTFRKELKNIITPHRLRKQRVLA
jgi:hypothetical protein